MDITEFYSSLEKGITADTDDLRFEEAVSLVDQERFDEAGSLIMSIFNEGNVDIRLAMYLFYSHLLENGILGLKEIFPAIATLLEDHWDKISPSELKEKHLLSSLTWLLSSISKKLKRSEKLYKEKKEDEFWAKSIGTLTYPDHEELKTLTRHFAEFIHQKLQEPSLNQHILFISKWLTALDTLVTPEAPPLPEPATEPSSPPINNVSLQHSVHSSEPMTLLLKKIQTFETLIEQENFEKAALVGDDIMNLIKNFDPTLFFPKLFTRYFALTAKHIDILSEEWTNKSSLKWESLSRLYHTDIDEFIQW